MAQLLNPDEIAAAATRVEAWEVKGNALERTFRFKDFRGALAFVNRVGELAEAANHHPDIDIRWNKVRLELSTHSAGGLTALDFDLAGQINAL
ncbi:MAG TPA: 4a-hydroxytetrahydrobiopterin dehydratase [Chthoniobacterales bacterium]